MGKYFHSENLEDSEEFSIKVIAQKKTEQIKQPDEDLPQLHFFCVVSAPRGSGKTELAKNLLLRKDMLKPFFKKDSIFIFGKSIDINGDYDNIDTKYKFTEFSNDLIKAILKAQSDVIKEYGKKRTKNILIVLDDVLDSNILDYRSAIETVATRGRHLKISCILITQSYMRVSRTMRINMDYLIFFRPHNESEMDRILDENTNKRERRKYEQRLKEVFKKKYSFVLIDYKTPDPERKWRIGFSTPFWEDSEEQM